MPLYIKILSTHRIPSEICFVEPKFQLVELCKRSEILPRRRSIGIIIFLVKTVFWNMLKMTILQFFAFFLSWGQKGTNPLCWALFLLSLSTFNYKHNGVRWGNPHFCSFFIAIVPIFVAKWSRLVPTNTFQPGIHIWISMLMIVRNLFAVKRLQKSKTPYDMLDVSERYFASY